MTTTKRLCAMLVSIVLLLFVGLTRAEAQLPKNGTYTGIYGWFFPAAGMVELGKDHMFWAGASTGAFKNDAGDGFLHRAVVLCPGSGELNKGAISYSGNCVVTDQEGDKVFVQWACKSPSMPFPCDFYWTGGTGKYTGIKGRNSGQDIIAGSSPMGLVGWSQWKGEWQLP
jgi:hypothetical protein